MEEIKEAFWSHINALGLRDDYNPGLPTHKSKSWQLATAATDAAAKHMLFYPSLVQFKVIQYSILKSKS